MIILAQLFKMIIFGAIFENDNFGRNFWKRQFFKMTIFGVIFQNDNFWRNFQNDNFWPNFSKWHFFKITIFQNDNFGVIFQNDNFGVIFQNDNFWRNFQKTIFKCSKKKRQFLSQFLHLHLCSVPTLAASNFSQFPINLQSPLHLHQWGSMFLTKIRQ